jgi:hypothetical protein
MRFILTLITVFLLSFQVSASEVTYSVNGIKKATELGPVETDTKSIPTGDHHCESSCDGESTRTSYRIDYRVKEL